jgi:hypothetical protein
MMNKPTTRHTLAAAALLVAFCSAARADDDRFSLHGFGNQDYSKSTANSFEQSGPTGTWDNNFLGLVMSASINDKSKVWAQLQANSTENPRLTWMFVDYQVTDDLNVHVGRVKFPFGIYNEFIDTRALQMSVGKPLAYSLEADLTYDAYNGIGIDYSVNLPQSGRLLIQGFGGNIFNPENPIYTPPYPNQFQLGNFEAVTNDLHVVGGKLTWETPIDGLRLLASVNQTKVITTPGGGQFGNEQGAENRAILSVDFARERVDVKAEFNYHKYPGLEGFADERSHAWYIQAALPMNAWTPYTRYDSVVTNADFAGDPSYYQRTVVIGINRRIATNLNFRIEDNFNHGYALPVAAGETLAGNGKVNWQLFGASINFMF